MRTEELSGCSKKELRALALRRRDALQVEVRREYGQLIVSRILETEEFRRAQTVMAYWSFGSEIDTGPLLRETVARGKRLLLPKVNRAAGALDVFEVRDLEKDLVVGGWGIREPDPVRCAVWLPEEVELAIVPGVAFDRSGGRIGYGKGYYDGLLAGCRAVTIAGAFEVQVFERVPMEAHDVRIGRIVTEAGC
jgi:5-formyltetrahydrofolate cyclo-ligase